jgi:eukaryotic-like serine/threonine-protein kinase
VETKLDRPRRAAAGVLDTEAVPDDPIPPSKVTPVDDTFVSAPLATQHVSDLPRFGRFRAVSKLGEGAMGTVYRAHDDVLGRPVAIKALHLRGEVAIRERFLREARAIGAVLHPNILAVYDAGSEDGTPYLVMELAARGSLRDRMKAGPLPVETVRKVGIEIARALAAAHAAGILHRDVKPANILAGQGDVWKLADFGIARLPDSTLTVAGEFLGSPSYAAPESLRAGQFSPASDVYGLGATLYEALTGVPPQGDHDIRSLIRKLEQEPVPIQARCPVPGTLGDAIMAALARHPAKRPSADEFARVLAADEPDSKPLLASNPWSRSRNLVIAVLGIGAAALGAAIVIAVDRSQPSAGASPMSGKPSSIDESNPDSLERSGETQAADPNAPSETSPDSEPNPQQPMIVDQYGNPVDEETARRVLEELERDPRVGYEWTSSGRGRGRWKR